MLKQTQCHSIRRAGAAVFNQVRLSAMAMMTNLETVWQGRRSALITGLMEMHVVAGVLTVLQGSRALTGQGLVQVMGLRIQ